MLVFSRDHCGFSLLLIYLSLPEWPHLQWFYKDKARDRIFGINVYSYSSLGSPYFQPRAFSLETSILNYLLAPSPRTFSVISKSVCFNSSSLSYNKLSCLLAHFPIMCYFNWPSDASHLTKDHILSLLIFFHIKSVTEDSWYYLQTDFYFI